MFVVITIMVFPLLILSPILSKSGATEGIEKIIPAVTKESSINIEAIYDARIDALTKDYNEQINKGRFGIYFCIIEYVKQKRNILPFPRHIISV